MADSDTPSLFDESEYQQRPGSKALVIRARKGRPLSKDQRGFNRLSKRIADLERRITTEREKLDLLLGRHREEVSPAEQALANQQIGLVKALAQATSRLALGKRHTGTLRTMILDLCDEAFGIVKPDSEAEALFDQWSEVTYREEVRRQTQDVKRGLADQMRYEYGIDVEVPDDDSPEAMARFFHQAREQAREASERDTRRRRAKNPTRESREALLAEREAATKKAIRDLYLSLAKVLHPDAVAEPEERVMREKYMKQATHAYRQGDLAELLTLELRWVRERCGPETLADEALRIYIPALQQQVTRLQRALEEQLLDPRYFPIGPVADLPQQAALQGLARRARDLRTAAVEIERLAGVVTRCTSKAAIARIAREYLDARDAEDADILEAMFAGDDWD